MSLIKRWKSGKIWISLRALELIEADLRKVIEELALEKTMVVHSTLVFITPFDTKSVPTSEKGYFVSLERWEQFKQKIFGEQK